MAKISPVSIKYMIYAKFVADGALEKPDVIGALFGQTEGLLGADLEMRDLQKEGKIGRIEVDIESHGGKTTGKIRIPSAMDKTETTLVAAAIETIERVGPSTAKIEIEKIEDVRGSKREYILERAKKLLEGVEEKMPKTREMAMNIKTETRLGKLQEYGKDKLPAGNLEGHEIIVVEGRADVLNLLRNGVVNVIGMDGTKLPETIKELSYDKEITLFVDGDRGGKLIAKNVIENARIDYIAFAPEGREVEELTDKDILSSLRRKIKVGEFLGSGRREKEGRWERQKKDGEEKPAEKQEQEEKDAELTEKDITKIKSILEQKENKKSVILLNKKFEVIGRCRIRGVFSSIERAGEKPYVIVVEKATQNIIYAAEKTNIKHIAAKNFLSSSDKVNLISL